jgi:hypothetical protein
MDQAALAHQSVLRHFAERDEDPGLDCNRGLRLVVIVKKRLKVQASLHTILQILSLALLEKQSLDQLLVQITNTNESVEPANQLNLFPQISGR